MAFFAARQPILDVDRNVYGYELLFRTSTENVFPDVDPEKATSKMIESLQFDLGLDKIASGKYAFINFTEHTILNSYPKLLPKSQVVIEVLESVQPTPIVINELIALSKEGFIIALDDFTHDPRWETFYDFCHIIKVDCIEVTEEQLSKIIELKNKYPNIKFLAEKVETYHDYKYYLQLGFELFQGYFFSKPEVMRSVSMSTSHVVLSNLLNEITQEDISINNISKLIETDVALSFKLLRYTQSPLFFRNQKIENIKQAVILLGQNELQRFVMFLVAASFGENKPTELIRLSMHRAKFCEQLTVLAGKNEQMSSAFLVGMLSLIDAMLDAELAALIGEMPLSENIKTALLLKKGWLADAILVCKLIEQGKWQRIDKACDLLNIEVDDLVTMYYEAETWATERIGFIL